MKSRHMHITLSKQLSKAGLSAEHPPKGEAVWRGFLDNVSRSYEDAENVRQRLERDLRISSAEVEYLKNQTEQSDTGLPEANRNPEEPREEITRLHQEQEHNRQHEQNLLSSRQMYARLISNIPVGVYSMRSVTDGRFWIEYVSPRMFEMMGMSSGNFTSDINNAFSAVHPEDREGFARLHIHSIRGHEPFEWEGRTLVKGEVKWTRIESYPLEQENGDMVWTGVVSDITEQKLAEMALEESNQKLALLSITDGLTGISNRRRFDEALSIECGRHVRSGGKLSLILLDIDHFKAFNDIYGHVHGDECLRRIARVIADCAARATDLPARYGGEEFACILPETDIGGALAIAERIRSGIESLAIPHDGSHVSDSVTASLGVLTVQPVLDGSINEIVHRVDELLYQAKSLGRNRIEYAKWP